MSDPADGPYTCCGRAMEPIMGEVSGGYAPVAWLCLCGVYRHATKPGDPRRAEVDRLMAAFLAERGGAQTP